MLAMMPNMSFDRATFLSFIISSFVLFFCPASTETLGDARLILLAPRLFAIPSDTNLRFRKTTLKKGDM